MSYHGYNDDLATQIGRLVLFPFKVVFCLLGGVILTLALVVLYIPGIVVFIVKAVDIPMHKRVPLAFIWPLVVLVGLLAMNDFLSLGGMDNRSITRLGEWLSKKSKKE